MAEVALGAVFGELLKAVLEAIRRCVNFKQTLTHLSTTLTRLSPKIEEIQELNNELGRPKEELESLLISTMREGKQLVLQCSKISRYDLVARTRYEGKLQRLIKSLERFITIDLQVQMAIDKKESLHLNRKALSLLRKICSGKAKENATASSSHSISTPVLEVVNESEQEEQSELLLSAPNDSMTSLEKSSTNGIDANAVTNKIKEVIVRGNLTVTVISAENLPALDFMRKSDPYVVLTLRKAKSKAETIYQTKVVNYSLNPVWNQTLYFVVEDGLHDMLIVEVWDHDTIGKDDFMGRCTLSLKRVIHEEEYEGRFKLVCAERFKLVGAESSYLKLHLKWMHQPTHSDSNFLPSFSNDLELKPVGILKVKLLQAKELTNEHTFRKPDLFVVLHMQASGEKGKESETINNDLNPIWNENFEFSVTDVSTEHLMVEVYDSNHLRSSKLIGCAEIRLSELQPGKVKYVWSKLETLENQRDNKIRGQVHVELLYCPLDKQFAPNYSGVLSVTVISAEDLPALDLMRKSDPFVVLTLRKAKLKEEIRNTTRVVNQSLDPIWNQKFAYDVEDGLHDMVIAEVWDKDPFGKDDYIGRCILSLTKVILEGEYTESFELVGAQSGSLKLHLKWRR